MILYSDGASSIVGLITSTTSVYLLSVMPLEGDTALPTLF